jgi:prepilin-type processing-associated H-X9-DG protein
LYNESQNNCGNHSTYSATVPIFLCPADYTVNWSNPKVQGWGATSYTSNYQVFGDPKKGDCGSAWFGGTKIENIPDGASYTILFTEKLSEGSYHDRAYGNQWARMSNADWMPMYAYGNMGGTSGYSTWSSLNGKVGLSSVPQWQPNYAQYDPTRPSSPHIGGINVAFCDGSVQFLFSTIGARTWWALTTPAGHEVIDTE